ncbi:hypothetical protein BpHYR1_021657 [Brachionus plicatilis]|uniref:Uncharacterized protein n=1 Tax=Brachionus plicatilis TaxID=10195 RepID=A0A3M7RUK7_BRAPC|nr:hypothetical protein BpHYR1_021657 [Brachionus plicatilis]
MYHINFSIESPKLSDDPLNFVASKKSMAFIRKKNDFIRLICLKLGILLVKNKISPKKISKHNNLNCGLGCTKVNIQRQNQMSIELCKLVRKILKIKSESIIS